MDLLSFHNASLFVAVIGAAIGLFVMGRWSYSQAITQAASGWKELSEVRAADIDRLKERVDSLDRDFRQVVKENEQLRALNLQYQMEIRELKERVRMLEPGHEMHHAG